MARPSKNSCDYFPHDAGMRNHIKIKAIRNKFSNGYAIWVMFLEYLTSSDGNVFEYNDLQFELLSGDFYVSATEIKEVIDYALKIEMIFNKNGYINSDSLDERLSPVYAKRGKSKEQSAKQKRENGKFATEIAEHTVVSVTEISQSKVNKTKVKKSKTLNFDFSNALFELGVELSIIEQWLIVRKSKKLTNSEIAFNSIKKEIELSTLSPNECILKAVEKSWGGFEAQWLNNTKSNKSAITNLTGNEQYKKF